VLDIEKLGGGLEKPVSSVFGFVFVFFGLLPEGAGQSVNLKTRRENHAFCANLGESTEDFSMVV